MNTNRDRLEAIGLGTLEAPPHGGEVGRLLDGAVGAHTLGDLQHALVQHVGLDDMARKNFRPRTGSRCAARRGNLS